MHIYLHNSSKNPPAQVFCLAYYLYIGYLNYGTDFNNIRHSGYTYVGVASTITAPSSTRYLIITVVVSIASGVIIRRDLSPLKKYHWCFRP